MTNRKYAKGLREHNRREYRRKRAGAALRRTLWGSTIEHQARVDRVNARRYWQVLGYKP